MHFIRKSLEGAGALSYGTHSREGCLLRVMRAATRAGRRRREAACKRGPTCRRTSPGCTPPWRCAAKPWIVSLTKIAPSSLRRSTSPSPTLQEASHMSVLAPHTSSAFDQHMSSVFDRPRHELRIRATHKMLLTLAVALPTHGFWIGSRVGKDRSSSIGAPCTCRARAPLRPRIGCARVHRIRPASEPKNKSVLDPPRRVFKRLSHLLGERDAPGGRPAPQRCGLGTPLCRGTRPTADATRHGDASRRVGHALASVAHAVASIRRSGHVPARGGGGTLSTYTTRSTGTSTIFSTTLSTGTCAPGGMSPPALPY
jgi:hypothetical protein